MSGWYIMHRGWMDSFKPEPFTEREAFLWSIEQAAFQAHDQWFNGHRVWVERGEFVTSIRQMAEAFQWSVKKTRGFMERMGKCQKWAQRTAYDGAQSPTVITVCNYAFYQDAETDEGTAKGTAKGTRGAQRGHSKGTQQKQGKQGNKGKQKKDSPSDSSSEPDDPNAIVPVAPIPDDQSSDPAEVAFAAHEALRREFAPAARPAQLSPDRRKKLAARLSEIGGAAGWASVLASIRASPFLRGETSRTGRLVATIDWLIEPKNLRKVMEGNYDDAGRSVGSGRLGSSLRPSPVDAAIAARNLLGLN
ncbi:hypothetical protein JQK15_03855 [Sphingobium sp. BHU LFT2]|uniref:hypothetical protein n=1 Tax=Sphingobium sp. BHU LFT2 TaxID=2807634 RepID=UPI001BE87995|nr:hypothetical protein [Sphingobium sp. BHU LFT2]MBT2242663.1 hypothetical protein [Sphingobium sp. BHU LFT2]